MNYSQTKTVRVSDITHKHLTRMARKGDSYDLVITKLIKEHLVIEMQSDIQKIDELCEGAIVLAKNDSGSAQRVMPLDDEIQRISEIFDEIDFDYGIYPGWELKDAEEMATDEDFVGSAVAFGERDLTLSEVAINMYCMYLEMPSPTFGSGALINPLAPH